MDIQSLDLTPYRHLRRFTPDDAVPMLEMMHDSSVNKFFRFDGNAKTMEDVSKYIDDALADTVSLHLAITTDTGEYVGSISLKNIDLTHKTAEYAIISAAAYHGKGYAYKATRELMDLAFNVLSLHSIFLDVYSDNERAISFYKKAGFSYEGESRECLFIRGEFRSLKWFRILESEFTGLE